MVTKEQKIKSGKKSKTNGAAFELRTRKGLEDQGYVVDRWTNNVEFSFTLDPHVQIGKIVTAKPHMVFNPKIRRMIPLQRNSGFPDLVAFRNINISKGNYEKLPNERQGGYDDKITLNGLLFDIIGVECKTNGKLDKEEKEKCRFYLRNKTFSKILIAEKIKVKNRIVIKYTDFETKFGEKQ